MESTPLNRRHLLIATVGLLVPLSGHTQEQDPLLPFDELQRGDPDGVDESVRVDPTAVADIVNGAGRAVFNPRNQEFPSKLLEVSQRFLGMDRDANRAEITAFLGLFDLPFETAGKPIAYCACGLGYAAALAYQEFWNPSRKPEENASSGALRESRPELDRYHFYPTPSVRDMYSVASGKRRWLEAATATAKPKPKPGYVVVFSFGRDANHCGIVESATDESLTTIEFNTTSGVAGDQRNGGVVARRVRAYNHQIKGFIATDSRV